MTGERPYVKRRNRRTTDERPVIANDQESTGGARERVARAGRNTVLPEIPNEDLAESAVGLAPTVFVEADTGERVGPSSTRRDTVPEGTPAPSSIVSMGPGQLRELGMADTVSLPPRHL